MIINVTDKSKLEKKSILVNESDNFEIFKEKVEKKFGFKIEKFVCLENGVEIDEDEIFFELLKIKPLSGVLSLVALKSNDQIDEDSKKRSEILSEVFSMRKDLEEMNLVSEEDSSDMLEKVKKEEERCELLKKKIVEKKEEIGGSHALKSFEEKKKKLLDEYNKLKFESVKTREARTSELRDIELRKVKLEERQAKISKLFMDLKNAEKVDICFMVDCTGSMSSYINEAKTVVHRVVDRLGKRFQDLKLRCAFVGYRDHSDGYNRVNVFAFTTDKDAFKSWVTTTVTASGGADECEDIFGGLEEVNKLEWSYMTRVLFHIGDAPCHGNRFHSGANDSYPGGDPRGLNIEDLLKGIICKNIDHYFAEINNSTKKMIEEFDKVLRENQGREIKKVKLSGAEDLLDTVSSSITTSIMASKSLSMHDGHGKPMKTCTVDPGPIKWSDLSGFDNHTVDFYKACFNGNLRNMKECEIKYEKRTAEVWLAKKPFAKGGLRYAFAALVNMGTKDKPHIVKSVMKTSIFKDEHYNSDEYYKNLIEVQIVAKYLADELMKVTDFFGIEKTIQFLDVNLAQITDTGVYYTVEDFVDGEFIKWTNNAGVVNEEDYASTLNAFSHWTYQATLEYLIVTDLQGFRTKTSYLLTDPAITCLDDWDRFSSTNLGQKGLKKFFSTHQCNFICESLKLVKHKYQLLPNKLCGTMRI